MISSEPLEFDSKCDVTPETVREAAISIAREICSNQRDPRAGASRIWRLASEIDYAEVEDLVPFAALASEWSDSPAYADDYANEIRLAAERLVAEADKRAR